MALTFSGTGQYLTLPTAIAVAPPFTLSCWFNIAVVNSNNVLQGLCNNSTDNSSFVQTIAAGPPIKLRAQAQLTGSSSSSISATIAPVGVWTHGVAVFASSTSRTIYVNAATLGADTVSKVPVGINISTIAASFAGNATAVNLVNGTIAYPTIWGIALSGTDITALYNAGAGRDPVTVQPASLLSLLYMQSGTPYFDNKQLATWTVVGSPTVVADPFTVTRTRALSGTSTAIGVHTGALVATKSLVGTCTGLITNTGVLFNTSIRTFIGPCTVTAANTGVLKAKKIHAGTCLVTCLNSGLVAPPPRYDLVSECDVTTDNTGLLTVINVVARHISGAATVRCSSYGQMTGPPRVVSDPPFPVMQWVSIGLQPIVLFILPPNFATEVKVTLSIMDQVQVTQNNKGSTRSFTNTGRYSVEMECLCSNAQESTEVRLGLNRLKDDLVALPLWVDLVVLTTVTLAGASTATYSGAFAARALREQYWIFINTTTYLSEIVQTSVSGTTVTFAESS